MIRVLVVSVILSLLAVVASNTAVACDDTADEINLTGETEPQRYMISVSQFPAAKMAIVLTSDDGTTQSVTFDPDTLSAVTKVIVLPPGHKYTAGIAAATVGDLVQRACWTSLTAEVRLASPGESVDTTKDASLTITIVKAAPLAPTAPLAAIMLGVDPPGAGGERNVLGNPVSEAVTQTLSLLAEIAMDKAKAEAMRLFKEKLVNRVCVDLTVDTVFGDGSTDVLLPTTCGQLDNLRLGDLGGSARGLVTALREDLTVVVLPRLLARVGLDLDPAISRTIVRFVVRAASSQMSSDEVRLTLVALVDDLATAAVDDVTPEGSVRRIVLRTVVEIAATCAAQSCSAADVIREIKAKLVPQGDLREALRRMIAEKLLTLMQHTITVETKIDPVVAAKLAKSWNDNRKKLVDDVYALLVEAKKNETMDKFPAALFAKLTENLDKKELEKVTDAQGAAKQVIAWLAKNPSIDDAMKGQLDALVGALPELSALVARARTALKPAKDVDPRQQASEIVSIVLDVVDLTKCSGDDACKTKVGHIRDVAIGAIEGDYLRALGGVAAVIRTCTKGGKPCVDIAKHRKAFALVASVMSYVDTFERTKGEDAKEARDQRKKALEALIEAGTDRTDRESGRIISLGATVGFLGGARRLPYRPGVGKVFDGLEAESFDLATDLRLGLGLSILWLREDGCQPFVSASFADLGQFVASPSAAGEAELQWSDFAQIGLQAGAAWNKQVPFVVAADVSWAPQLRYSYSTTTTMPDPLDPTHDITTTSEGTTEGVFRIGVFLGFNVPFFDLN